MNLNFTCQIYYKFFWLFWNCNQTSRHYRITNIINNDKNNHRDNWLFNWHCEKIVTPTTIFHIEIHLFQTIFSNTQRLEFGTFFPEVFSILYDKFALLKYINMNEESKNTWDILIKFSNSWENYETAISSSLSDLSQFS